MRVAASWSLTLNTPSTLLLHAHLSLVTQLHHIYTVRARALNKETKTSNKKFSLSFTHYYMVAAVGLLELSRLGKCFKLRVWLGFGVLTAG